MTNNNVFYISPYEAEKDDDGDVIMTDYVEDKNNTTNTCIIDEDTTSVSTYNENNYHEYDNDEDGDYDYDYDY